MVEQLCPVCGCTIGDKAHEKGGVTYCCEPCSIEGAQCSCGCCEIVEEKSEEQK